MTGHVFMITGFLDVDKAFSLDAKPLRYFTTNRRTTHQKFKEYCLKAKDPKLVKVLYCRGDLEYDVTKEFQYEWYDKLVAKKTKTA